MDGREFRVGSREIRVEIRENDVARTKSVFARRETDSSTENQKDKARDHGPDKVKGGPCEILVGNPFLQFLSNPGRPPMMNCIGRRGRSRKWMRL